METPIYHQLSRRWHDQDIARDLDEAVHERDLERAAHPPDIEVTVTAPPEGISRAELNRRVRDEVTGFTGSPRGRVAFSGRRLRDYLLGESDPVPGVREVQVP